MTIDEAIAKEKEEAKYQNSKYDKCPTRMLYCCEMCFHNPKCNEVAEQCEQLAERQEELKMLRELKEEHRKIGNIEGFNKGYNKAIDDFYIRFICEVKNRYPDMPIVDIVRNKWEQKNSQYIECEEIALKIAEQLKEGVNINE